MRVRLGAACSGADTTKLPGDHALSEVQVNVFAGAGAGAGAGAEADAGAICDPGTVAAFCVGRWVVATQRLPDGLVS